jgi:hypothetical protein
MDLYIVLSGYNPRSELRQEILETTNRLAEQLVVQDGVSKYIRRTACKVTLDENRQLTFTKEFSHSGI